MARLEPTVQSGGLLKLYQALWAPYYQAVLNVLGSTGVILPIGDPHHGQPNATTFTTKGEEQLTFTWSEAPSAFDTALDLTSPDSFQGIVPVVTLNGTDEEADSPDATYWSRGDGSNDFPMSLGLWAYLVDPTSSSFLSKYGAGGSQEYIAHLNGADKLQFIARDGSAALEVNRLSDAAVSADVWHHIVLTYDGTGGATAMDGATWYLDGAAVASTATNNGGYVAMENTGQAVELGDRTNGSFFDGKMAGGPLGPFFAQVELTADQVRALYDLGRAALAL